MLRSTSRRLASLLSLAFAFHVGMVPVAEPSEPTQHPVSLHAFFALDRRDLDDDAGSVPSLFGDAFRVGKGAGSGETSPFFASAILLHPAAEPAVSELGSALSPGPLTAEAGALASLRFDPDQKIQVPAGLCRTSQCKTLVVIGAAVAGGGVALIAAGGEGNRKLGTALALGGCGLIVLVLLLD